MGRPIVIDIWNQKLNDHGDDDGDDDSEGT